MLGRLHNIPRTAIRLLLAVVIAASAVVMFTANEVRLARQSRIAETESDLQATSRSLAAQLERDIQSVRLVMTYARNLAANHDLRGPGIGPQLYPALHNLALGMPLIGNLLLINSEGKVVASSQVAEQALVDVADRPYFRFHSENGSSELRIGENALSRTLAIRVVQFSLRIDRPDGEFAGVVVVALRHEYFAGLFQSFAPQEGGAAALIRLDGRMLARYPVPEDSVFEQDFSKATLFAALAKAPSGNFRVESALIGGEPRFFAYRTVGALPLAINVSQHRDAVLAPWVQGAWRQWVIALFAIAAIAGLGAIVLQQALRRESQTRALAASEARFRAIIDGAPDPIFLIRPDGMVVSTNVQASVALDLPPAAIAGRPLGQFLVEPEGSRFLHAVEMLETAQSHCLEGVLQGSNEVTLPVEVHFSRVEDAAGETLYLGLARDISERKAYQAQLERLANFDELTQVPKRNLFMDRLEQSMALARRKERQVGVLFVDLDRFKEINDTLGHACGDEVLQRAALRMLGCLRQVDTVGRYGGDEFVVLIPEIAQAEDIETVANKLCDVFRAPFDIKDRNVVVNASIGIAIFPRDGETAEGLVRHADEAMYAAKLAGRNQVRQYAS